MKNQMFILDYIQLLMISWVIRAKNINQNAKKWKRPPTSLKNQMFIFGLHSTSDDRPCDLNKKCQPNHKKNEKGPLSHQKNKCSFLDYVQLLMIGQAIRAKNINQNVKKQKRPLSHQKIKCSFLDYVQLLMIGQAIQAKNVDQTIKKWKRPPESSKNKMFIFGLHSTSDVWPSNLSKKHQPKHKKMKKAP